MAQPGAPDAGAAEVLRAVSALARLDVPADAAFSADLGAVLRFIDALDGCEGADGARGVVPTRADLAVCGDASALRAVAPRGVDEHFSVPLRRTQGATMSETPTAPTAAPAEKPLVDISVFGQLELKSGKILEAAAHPKADRLVVLQVDVGEEKPRQIVAGIKAYYPEVESLVGRTIIVVCNLVPAELRGVRSEGMLLAAGGKNHRGLVTVAGDCPPGEPVK